MSFFDTMGMCLRNLLKRKLRTFLTLLGVVIGTGSIIIMISLGLATDAQFARMLEDLSLDMTQITVNPHWGGMIWDPETNTSVEAPPRDITDDSIARIAQVPGVRLATPIMNAQLLFRSGPYAMHASVTGITPYAMANMGFDLSYGRFLEEDDGFAVVFGSAAERHFFSTTGGDMWGSRFWEGMWGGEVETYVDIYNAPIRMYYDLSSLRLGGFEDEGGIDIEEAFRPVRSFELNIVGVLEPISEWDPWQDGVIYMDIEMLQLLSQMSQEAGIRAQEENEHNPRFSARSNAPRQTYSQVTVFAENIDLTREVAGEIRSMGYQVWFQGDWIESEMRSQQAMQALLAAIAAVSLFVAAINIANTMVTSVTERTREIGIMKVIGASLADVRKLFLTEAVFIGILGGVFGIILALALSYALNNFEIEFLQRINMAPPIRTEGAAEAVVSLITPWLLGVALAVASGVGLISGIFPAWHATRLSALAAIRND